MACSVWYHASMPGVLRNSKGRLLERMNHQNVSLRFIVHDAPRPREDRELAGQHGLISYNGKRMQTLRGSSSCPPIAIAPLVMRAAGRVNIAGRLYPPLHEGQRMLDADMGDGLSTVITLFFRS